MKDPKTIDQQVQILIDRGLIVSDIEIAKEFLNRPISEKQPKLIFEPKSNNFFEFTIDDFRIEDYLDEKISKHIANYF